MDYFWNTEAISKYPDILYIVKKELKIEKIMFKLIFVDRNEEFILTEDQYISFCKEKHGVCSL